MSKARQLQPERARARELQRELEEKRSGLCPMHDECRKQEHGGGPTRLGPRRRR